VRHTVSINDCKIGPIEVHIASSHGNGSQKRLTGMVSVGSGDILYVVTDHHEKSYEGTSLVDAVNAYNAAP
jgi:hypothetical protein